MIVGFSLATRTDPTLTRRRAVTHGRLTVLFGILLLTVPTSGRAQAADTVYVAESRSPFLSGLFEYLTPTAGYAYAGDWQRGLLPNTVRVTGVVLLVRNFDGGSAERSVLGAFAAVGGTVWAVIGAGRTAKRMSGKSVPKGSKSNTSGIVVTPSPGRGVEIGYRWKR